jgi:DNA repair exonuclease SbcCD nuclease subunit
LEVDSEDECVAGHGEGDGPPNVSSEKLQELEEKAALDEVEKLYKMEVIEPVTLSEDAAVNENVVDTTLVYDWRFRTQQWIRRCRIVARELKTGATDENNFSPRLHLLQCACFSPLPSSTIWQ